MTRTDDRAQAAATLTALGLFQAVYAAPRRSFDGLSPIASVISAGMTPGTATRGRSVGSLDYRLSVAIYVRADSGAEAAAEDLLDRVTQAAVLALAGAGFAVAGADAAPDGTPLRLIDGIPYRAERITISREEYL